MPGVNIVYIVRRSVTKTEFRNCLYCTMDGNEKSVFQLFILQHSIAQNILYKKKKPQLDMKEHKNYNNTMIQILAAVLRKGNSIVNSGNGEKYGITTVTVFFGGSKI